ncbi:ABC transporter permease [Bacillus alveayuensis]|jgi:putative tryptophan/tyrosine transport system permease protein|uniref:ABC transport system permease protein n=1 Tax=Aeribacillus alveayuensis TaxID=279215 RepID=A0ABT9VN78_9BACI|nr:ABC transporter permease [Bacillus alveayuensis]MDQ0162349.1 putative ABC transport system permease protein [Bacillus alveayuensis]
MPIAIFGSIESGLIYAMMALGVYLSFRILDFPDLTVDGSFVTGAAVCAVMIVNGWNPVLATISAIFVGFIAGSITGLLHTKGKINPLLSGILMMIALYSINLRIMGRSNVPLLQEETFFSHISGIFAPIDELLTALIPYSPSTWSVIFSMLVFVIVLKFILDYFLKTEIGLALRAVGDNQQMIESFSANTDILKIIGLGLSNALVALSGAFVAQYSGFSDIGMGIGMIIIGLASVIIGEALIGSKSIVRATLAVIIGAIVYRLIVAFALRFNFFETGDLKLITACIVILSLTIPRYIDKKREKKRKLLRRKELEKKRGEQLASTKAHL